MSPEVVFVTYEKKNKFRMTSYGAKCR